MTVFGDGWPTRVLDLPKKPPPARPDTRWESVYATIEKEPDTGFGESHRVTIHLTLGTRDHQWYTLVPWQQPWRMVGGWPRILDTIVHNVHVHLGWADDDHKAEEARIEAEFAARKAAIGPPPSLLARFDADYASFGPTPPVDPYLQAIINDIAAERDKPRASDAVIITGV